MDFAQGLRAIEGARRIAVVGHLRPDADAVGSVCAVVLAMRELGFEAVGAVGQTDPLSRSLLSIPGARDVVTPERLPDCDAAIVVDCADLQRTGTCAEGLAELDRVVVVDHHVSNPRFGTVNLVDPTAESTTVVLTRWFTAIGLELGAEIAHCLYAGLVTDTGSFRWGGPGMHDVAATLLATGIDAQSISRDLLDQTDADSVRMIGRALGTIRAVPAGAHHLAVITADHQTVQTGSREAVEQLVDFVRAVDGTDVGVVMKELEPGRWSLSLRSTRVDVAGVAAALGGGGHRAAAGVTLSGDRDGVLLRLVEVLRG